MFNTSINLTATVLFSGWKGEQSPRCISTVPPRCDVQAALVLFPVEGKGAGHPQRITLRVLPVFFLQPAKSVGY